MEGCGGRIKGVKRVRFSPPAFLGAGFFLVMIVTALMGKINAGNLSYEDKVTLPLGIFFVTFVLYWSYTLDRKSFILNVCENGLKGNILKWSGSDFLSWREVKNIQLVERGAIVIEVHNPKKYWDKCPFVRKIFFLEFYNKYGTPFIIGVSGSLSIDPVELFSLCNTALNNYRATHDAKP